MGDNGRRREPNEPEARGKLARPEPALPSGAPEPAPASPTRLRPNEPEVFAASLAHLQPDPDEAMRVAGRGGMRLHRCDGHLGYARLGLAEGNKDQPRGHVAEAKRPIDETGYGGRRPEVEALEAEVH